MAALLPSVSIELNQIISIKSVASLFSPGAGIIVCDPVRGELNQDFQEQKCSSAALVPLEIPSKPWLCTFFVRPALKGSRCDCKSDPPMVGIRSPIGLVVGSCTSHSRVLGSIPKREEPGKTGAPCVKVPGSSQVPCPPLSSSPPREQLCNNDKVLQ